MANPALLTPSLVDDRPQAAIYSTRATFFTAFVGGPLSAVLIHGLNSHRLGRLRKDAAALTVATLAVVAFVAYLVLRPPSEPRIVSHLGRVAGVLVWGGLYLWHRPLHNAAQLHAGFHPKPWPAGLACVVLGTAAFAGLTLGVRALFAL